jgi:hypothetical protein
MVSTLQDLRKSTMDPSLLFSHSISHLIHASDANQLEALLIRWGPDGVGKLGGQFLSLYIISFQDSSGTKPWPLTRL